MPGSEPRVGTAPGTASLLIGLRDDDKASPLDESGQSVVTGRPAIVRIAPPRHRGSEP